MTPTRARALTYQDIFIRGTAEAQTTLEHVAVNGTGEKKLKTPPCLNCSVSPNRGFGIRAVCITLGGGRRLHPGGLEGHSVLQPREKQHVLLHSDGSNDSQQLSFMTTDCTVQLVQSRATRVSGVTRSRTARVRWLERLTCTCICLRTGRKGEDSWQTAAAWKTTHTQR